MTGVSNYAGEVAGDGVDGGAVTEVPGDPDGGGVLGGDVVDHELEVGADGPHELAEEADDPLPPHERPREHQVLVHAALGDERLHRRQVAPVHAVVERPHNVRRRRRSSLPSSTCRCCYGYRPLPPLAAATRPETQPAGEAAGPSRTGGGHSGAKMERPHRECPSRLVRGTPASVLARSLISSRTLLLVNIC